MDTTVTSEKSQARDFVYYYTLHYKFQSTNNARWNVHVF